MTYNVDASKLNYYKGKILKDSEIELKLMKYYSRNNLTTLLDSFLSRVEKFDSIVDYNALISFITDLEMIVHNGIYRDLIFKEIKNLTVVNVFIKDNRIVLTIELEEW